MCYHSTYVIMKEQYDIRCVSDEHHAVFGLQLHRPVSKPCLIMQCEVANQIMLGKINRHHPSEIDGSSARVEGRWHV
jgi:hypothetical protein